MKYNLASALAIAFFALAPSIASPQEQAATDKGIDLVTVAKTQATVTKVDLQKRKVSLELENGKHKTFKVHDDVQNLDKIQVGDKLELTYADELLLDVGSSQAVGASGGSAIAVASKGEKPAMVMVDTSTVTVKILDVDLEKRHVTVEEPDGKKKTLKVSKKFDDLSKLKVGSSVTATFTEALAVEIVK